MANKNFKWEGRVTSSQNPLYEHFPGKKIISNDADEVVEFLQEDKKNEVLIKISSKGGEVYEAKTIVAKLQPYKSRVNFEIVGYAASAAAYIPFAAGNKIYIREGSTLMIHEASVTYLLPMKVDDLKKEIDLLSMINENLIEVIAKRSKLTEKEVAQALKNEKEFSAKQALKDGLVDEILEEDDDSKEAYKKYKNEQDSTLKIYMNYMEDQMEKKEEKEIKEEEEVKEEKLEEKEEIKEEPEKELKNTEVKIKEKEKKHMSKTVSLDEITTLEEARATIVTLQDQIENLNDIVSEYEEYKEKNRREKNETVISDALHRNAISIQKKEYWEEKLENADEGSAEILRDHLRNINSDPRFGSRAKRFSDYNDVSFIPTERLEQYKDMGKTKEQMLELEKMLETTGVN